MHYYIALYTGKSYTTGCHRWCRGK